MSINLGDTGPIGGFIIGIGLAVPAAFLIISIIKGVF